MTQNINQFVQTPEPGDVDLQFHGSVVSGMVVSSQVVDLVAGQAVKLVDNASPIPAFASLAADTEAAFGFVVRNLKDQDFPAYSRLEIAMPGTVIYMTAGAAIARGAKVEVVSATNKVITNAGTNPVVGFAYDKAAADGDLIRVWILSSFQLAQVIADVAGLQAALDAGLKVAVVTATLAEINAGKTLVAGVTGKAITVTNLTARVAGNFAATTSVDVQSSNGTPVKTNVLAVAALTTGAVLIPGSANTTLGAGFAVPLGADDGLRVVNTGSAATTGTSIQFTVTYKQA